MDAASRALLGAQWQRAAEELKIEIQVPFKLEAPDGALYEFACLLPQFGAPHGMLLDVRYEQCAADAAAKAEYGFSYMDAETRVPFDLSGYVDCLHDWGWASDQQRPPKWYSAHDVMSGRGHR